MSAPAHTGTGASGSDSAAAAAPVPKRPLDSGAAAEQRRVQPRVGPGGLSSAAHLDDNSAAALPQPFADSHADAPAQPPPTADRLHRHALESIFAFLCLRDLAAALGVSRDWLSAVNSMRRLELSVEQLEEDQRLDEMAKSPLARHVVELEFAQLSVATLAVLADRMAHLRELGCALSLSLADPPLAFPARLRYLEVHLVDPADEAQINAAIAAIGQLSLLEDLTVRLDELDPQISLAPLAALPLLRSLDIGARLGSATEFSDAQIDELRQMPRLREVDVPITRPLLRRLLRQPHNLQWQKVRLPFPVADETAALLPQLPSLTAIDAVATCERFEWLRGLPDLTDVNLSLNIGGDADGRAASLVSALQHCTNIEILGLICRDLTAAQLVDLLPRLPRLRELRLGDLLSDSLSFLDQPPLTTQLSRLALWNCKRLPLAELRHVHRLRGLTHLTLHGSCTAPLDSADLALLTPPSALLPRLVEFEYKAR